MRKPSPRTNPLPASLALIALAAASLHTTGCCAPAPNLADPAAYSHLDPVDGGYRVIYAGDHAYDDVAYDDLTLAEGGCAHCGPGYHGPGYHGAVPPFPIASTVIAWLARPAEPELPPPSRFHPVPVWPVFHPPYGNPHDPNAAYGPIDPNLGPMLPGDGSPQLPPSQPEVLPPPSPIQSDPPTDVDEDATVLPNRMLPSAQPARFRIGSDASSWVFLPDRPRNIDGEPPR